MASFCAVGNLTIESGLGLKFKPTLCFETERLDSSALVTPDLGLEIIRMGLVSGPSPQSRVDIHFFIFFLAFTASCLIQYLCIFEPGYNMSHSL